MSVSREKARRSRPPRAHTPSVEHNSIPVLMTVKSEKRLCRGIESDSDTSESMSCTGNGGRGKKKKKETGCHDELLNQDVQSSSSVSGYSRTLHVRVKS